MGRNPFRTRPGGFSGSQPTHASLAKAPGSKWCTRRARPGQRIARDGAFPYSLGQGARLLGKASARIPPLVRLDTCSLTLQWHGGRLGRSRAAGTAIGEETVGLHHDSSVAAQPKVPKRTMIPSKSRRLHRDAAPRVRRRSAPAALCCRRAPLTAADGLGRACRRLFSRVGHARAGFGRSGPAGRPAEGSREGAGCW